MIVTRTLWPTASVPEAGEAVSLPSRPDGTDIDHETEPPAAVSVHVPPSSEVSTTLEGDTLSVPWPRGVSDSTMTTTVTNGRRRGGAPR